MAICTAGRHICWGDDFPGGENVLDPQRTYLDTLRRHGTEGIRDREAVRRYWHCISFEPTVMARVLLEALRKTGRCTVLLNTAFTRVQHESRRLTAVELDNGQRIAADGFVDGTADALVCAALGCETVTGQESRATYGEPDAPEQANLHINGVSLIYRVTPAQRPAVEPAPEGVPEVCWWGRQPAAVFNAYPSGGDLNIYMLPTMQGAEFLQLGYPLAYAECRRRVWRHLQRRFEEFRGYRLLWIAPSLGVRETRRVLCQAMLTQHDLLAGMSGQTHSDIIAISDHTMDTHGSHRATHGELSQPYGVPLRCLIPRGWGNLFIACRAAGFSSIAASSCRLTRTMMQLGQAAGTAAAAAKQQGVEIARASPAQVRQMLRDQGAQVDWPTPAALMARLREDRGANSEHRGAPRTAHPVHCRPGMTPTARTRQIRAAAVGLAFLSPNIAGFLAFTLAPLALSLVLAFSNWDLKLHNMFKPEEKLRFVGLEHFTTLFRERYFWQYLGNTLFLMMGLPLGIAASLWAAMLLSRQTRAGEGRVQARVIVTAVMVSSAALLVALGAGATAMTLLFTGLAGLVLVGGVLGGTSVYRTLFYVPSFTSGVATFILWKQLYKPNGGPINAVLTPLLEQLEGFVRYTGPTPWTCLRFGLIVLGYSLFAWGLRKLRVWWRDGEVATGGLLLPIILVSLPIVLVLIGSIPGGARLAWVFLVAGVLWQGVMLLVEGRPFRAKPGEGLGNALLFSSVVMVLTVMALGLAEVMARLPAMAAQTQGLQPPNWLTDFYWAKPALMIMGFWGAIGSNSMLLYLAALTNVPQEMYEAADIDGASGLQKFWNVTWPQLAPTTFFLVVMGVIGGLQGGFESARVMTGGGPSGATTTLAYFIYTEGFETGRLGYSSAVAWAMFLLVLGVTLLNWKFGNRYVND